jgi:hypothetical protein
VGEIKREGSFVLEPGHLDFVRRLPVAILDETSLQHRLFAFGPAAQDTFCDRDYVAILSVVVSCAIACASSLNASKFRGRGFDPRRAHFLQKFSRSQKFPLAQRFDSVEQILFARDASDLVAQLTVLEKEQGWDRADIVFERETLIFVHVNFRYFDGVQFFASNLIQQRRDHFAGATPFGPKIDDYRLVVLRHFAVKIGFSEIDNMGIVHGFKKDKSKSE